MFGLVPFRKGGSISRRHDIWDIGSFLEDFFNDSFFGGFTNVFHPIKADVRETDKEFIVEAELPGVNKEDIKLEVRDDVLTISVENKVETNEERENYIRRERRYGSYSRSFYLDNVEHEGIKAKYNNGVLTITLPKVSEGKGNKRKIQID